MPNAASTPRGSPSFQQDPMDNKPAQEDKFTESLQPTAVAPVQSMGACR